MASRDERTPYGSTISNHEVVVLAVYLLGGQTHQVDTEDAAVKANEIAPGRFTWRKHKDQINIENVRLGLRDAARLQKGAYLIGSQRKGWMLTVSGVQLAQRIQQRLGDLDLSGTRLNPTERAWITRERRRMISEPAFDKFREGRISEVSIREAESFFHLDDYITGKARETKLQRFLNLLGDDPEVGGALRALLKVLTAEAEENVKE